MTFEVNIVLYKIYSFSLFSLLHSHKSFTSCCPVADIFNFFNYLQSNGFLKKVLGNTKGKCMKAQKRNESK